MVAYNFYPGSMGLAGLCVTLFGADLVEPNAWTEPVTVNNISDDDADVIVSLAKEKGVDIKYQRFYVSA